VGVVSLSWLAVRLGVATRPNSLEWSVLAAGSLLTGIGFTMALFIAGLAFGPDMLGAAKVGILGASAVAGTAGLPMLSWLTSIRRSSSETAETGQ
jgi:NhaA family Na+:H+ antiporter